MAMTYLFKVFILNPLHTFLGMPSFCPAPQRGPNSMVNILKYHFGNRMPIILTPSDSDRIKQSYQIK